MQRIAPTLFFGLSVWWPFSHLFASEIFLFHHKLEFDPARHLSREAVVFNKDGVILSIIKTKTIQNTERVLKIHLPRIPGSLVCPAQALLLSFKMAPANSSCSPAFIYKNSIKVIPLTYSVFLSKLKRFLSVLGINNTLYSGHSFRWGGRGASFALECDVPPELIQSHGDWKSDTYKKYLDPSFQHRQLAMNRLAQALCKT